MGGRFKKMVFLVCSCQTHSNDIYTFALFLADKTWPYIRKLYFSKNREDS